MSIYEQYIQGLIEVKDMTKEQFNTFMIEYYADYKSRKGKLSFQEFIKFNEEYVF